MAGGEATFDNGVDGRLAWVTAPTGVPIVISATGPKMTALAGNAREVAENPRRVLDHPAIERVILTPQVTGPGARPSPEVLRAFADEVLPRL